LTAPQIRENVDAFCVRGLVTIVTAETAIALSIRAPLRRGFFFLWAPHESLATSSSVEDQVNEKLPRPRVCQTGDIPTAWAVVELDHRLAFHPHPKRTLCHLLWTR
jgi:hypothetical protein